MIFRQLFDRVSCTYTYVIASRKGGEALIIDPVIDRVDHYLQVLCDLDLRLVKAVDTHVHADHVTGLAELRDRTNCITVMGSQSGADVVGLRVREGDQIRVEGISLDVIYTPGHTDDSYSFRSADRVFTGDTLLIRGTGRTDFQNGDANASFDSIFNKLLRLPDETLVFPAHDYNGNTVSTIAEERSFNPRLQVDSVDGYVDIMNNLNLANPKMMDVAVPANKTIGLDQAAIAARGWAVSASDFLHGRSSTPTHLIDLREPSERHHDGALAEALSFDFSDLQQATEASGLLRSLARRHRLIFVCSWGEISGQAVQMARERGIDDCFHLAGGVDALLKAGGELDD